MRQPALARPAAIALATIIALVTPAAADEEGERFVQGGDVYAAGDAADLTAPTERNAFLAGGSVEVEGDVARNAHIAAFEADVEAPVAGDLYAAAALVSIGAPVAGDVTAAAYRVTVQQPGSVGGNLRTMARTVEINGDVAGSAVVAAGGLTLSGTVTGDLFFAGRTIDFGPDARVDGDLTIRAPRVVEVPPTVAAPDRVTFAPLDVDTAEGFSGEAAEEALGFELPSTLTIVAVAVTAFLVLLLVGILFLGLAPRTVEGLRAEIEMRMWRSFGFGLIGLATLLGLVPLAAISIVGIPLIPILIPILALVAAFAWLLGAYTLSHRVFRTFGAGLTSMGTRLLVFIIGVLVLAGLNAVPVLGWLLNAFASLIGFGALQMRLVETLDRATPRREAAEGTAA
jgi:cytoskeletal protein CcmA (bactofilin family)